MKIALYDDYKVGLLKDGHVVDVSGVVPRGGTPQLTVEGLITIGPLECNVRDPLQRRWPKEIDTVSARDVREGTGGPGRRTRPLG